MRRIARSFIMVMLLCLPMKAVAQSDEQQIVVDFSTGQLWHFHTNDQPDVYQVVLPKTEVQTTMGVSRPVHGHLTQADYKPTWWPTQNMRAGDSTLPKSVPYGNPRHPIGLFRLRIDWQNPINPNFWNPVRIHGGAKEVDLNQYKSAGCVRMLDEDIDRLVRNIEHAKGKGMVSVRVTFGYLQ